jgi:hypothetical protein
MIDRIIRAFKFQTDVYKEVEEDETFTPSAWLIVAAVSFLANMGSNAQAVYSIGGQWVVSALVGR